MAQLSRAALVTPETVERIRACAVLFTFTGYAFAGIGFVVLTMSLGAIARICDQILVVALVPASALALVVGVLVIVVVTSFRRHQSPRLVFAAAIVSLAAAALISAATLVLTLHREGNPWPCALLLFLFPPGIRTLLLLAASRVKDAFVREARRIAPL
jgi:hypothetical protein